MAVSSAIAAVEHPVLSVVFHAEQLRREKLRPITSDTSFGGPPLRQVAPQWSWAVALARSHLTRWHATPGRADRGHGENACPSPPKAGRFSRS